MWMSQLFLELQPATIYIIYRVLRVPFDMDCRQVSWSNPSYTAYSLPKSFMIQVARSYWPSTAAQLSQNEVNISYTAYTSIINLIVIRDASVGFHLLTLSDHLIGTGHTSTSRPHGSQRDLAFEWPGGTRLIVSAHEVQESLHICLCVARLGNIRHLLQLLQSLTVRCDLRQAFLQGLLSSRLFLLHQASRVAWDRIIAWGIPQFRKLCLTLGCLQEMVVRAGHVHCCAIGRNGRCTRGDCSYGASTKCVDIQKVLAESTMLRPVSRSGAIWRQRKTEQSHEPTSPKVSAIIQ